MSDDSNVLQAMTELRVSLEHSRMENHVEIMSKLRALEVTFEGLRSQNSHQHDDLERNMNFITRFFEEMRDRFGFLKKREPPVTLYDVIEKQEKEKK